MAPKRPALTPDAKTFGNKMSLRRQLSAPNCWCHKISAPKRIGAQIMQFLYQLLCFYDEKIELKVINFCKKKNIKYMIIFRMSFNAVDNIT